MALRMTLIIHFVMPGHITGIGMHEKAPATAFFGMVLEVNPVIDAGDGTNICISCPVDLKHPIDRRILVAVTLYKTVYVPASGHGS